MRVLAIETSCDETAIALVEIKNKNRNQLPVAKVLKSIVSSQVKIHAPFGGVVPNLAKREHIKNLPLIWKKFLKHPVVKNKKVDLITVTVGPGLEPALWTGILFARKLHEEYFNKKIPLVGANHLYGHLYSFLLARNNPPLTIHNSKLFPMISLIVSGGHTILGVLKNLHSFKKLGETKDDAVGECFDKVARLLELPYPGGPEIEKMALRQAQGKQKNEIQFPSPMIHQKNYDFSYSGLKTAVLYYIKGQDAKKEKGGRRKVKVNVVDIAAGFQEAAFKVLVKKTMRAADEFYAQSVSVGGGVAASKALRKMLKKGLELPENTGRGTNSRNLLMPPFKYCMDNGVIIALAGYFAYMQKKKYPLEADGNLNL